MSNLEIFIIVHFVIGLMSIAVYIITASYYNTDDRFKLEFIRDCYDILIALFMAGTLSPIILVLVFWSILPVVRDCIKRDFYIPTPEKEFKYMQRLLVGE